MHDPRSVANAFIQRADIHGQTITPLQVQKLVFLAHGWMLGLHDRPMIDEDFEVWRYGPVNPSVYYCLSHHRGDPVKGEIPLHPADKKDFDRTEQNMLDDVFSLYGALPGMRLSALTHAPGSPYRQAKRKGLSHIPEDTIKSYYRKQVEEARERQRRGK